MLDAPFRHAVNLILILALAAGIEMHCIPGANASPHDITVVVANGSDDCTDCALGKVAMSECGITCSSIAVLNHSQLGSVVRSPAAWPASAEQLQSHYRVPDIALPEAEPQILARPFYGN